VSRRYVLQAAGIGIVVVLFISFFARGGLPWLWAKYRTDHTAMAPLLTLAAGLTVAGVALLRHFAQTDADRQRRITESFSKAIEQLGSDKVEVRLGGIYSLERISKESLGDYWTVMSNLTAFIRGRSRRMEIDQSLQFHRRVSDRAYFLWLEAGRPEESADFFWESAIVLEKFGERQAADIASALTVIVRRSEAARERETANDWRLDLTGAVLRGAHLPGANFERAHLSEADLGRANLIGANLEGANLIGAHLERANLSGANLKKTNLSGAYLERADLSGANLEQADLRSAHLERVHFYGANFKQANLSRAHLEEANLSKAHLEEANLSEVHLEGANLSGAFL
jgi:hypothetical protein